MERKTISWYLEAKFLHPFSIPRLTFRQGCVMNPGYIFTAQKTPVGIKQSRMRRAQGQGFILWEGLPSQSGVLFLWGARKLKRSCPATELFLLSEPKGYPFWSPPLPCQHPSPNNFPLGSRVLFWLTAHLASTMGPMEGAVDEEAKLWLWKTVYL